MLAAVVLLGPLTTAAVSARCSSSAASPTWSPASAGRPECREAGRPSRRPRRTGHRRPPPPTWGAPPAEWPAPAPQPPKERSVLTRTTLSVALLVTGLLLALHVAGVDGITAPRVVATALLVVGGGLVVGTWYGRGRWLIAVGLLLALGLGAAVVAQRVGVQDGVGQRQWVATDGGDFRLGAGEAVLDLRDLRGTAGAEVQARVGVGHLVVLVPADLTARVTSEASAGVVEVVELDGSRSRTDLDGHDPVGGADTVVGTGDVTASVDLEVGLGQIEVRRVRS